MLCCACYYTLAFRNLLVPFLSSPYFLLLATKADTMYDLSPRDSSWAVWRKWAAVNVLRFKKKADKDDISADDRTCKMCGTTITCSKMQIHMLGFKVAVSIRDLSHASPIWPFAQITQLSIFGSVKHLKKIMVLGAFQAHCLGALTMFITWVCSVSTALIKQTSTQLSLQNVYYLNYCNTLSAASSLRWLAQESNQLSSHFYYH